MTHETTLTTIDPNTIEQLNCLMYQVTIPVLTAESSTQISATPETEINVLDGITSTFVELNILDGVTATDAED